MSPIRTGRVPVPHPKKADAAGNKEKHPSDCGGVVRSCVRLPARSPKSKQHPCFGNRMRHRGVLMIVNHDVTGISMDKIPLGIRLLFYPAAVLTYLISLGVFLVACFRLPRKHILFLLATTIALVSMMFMLTIWLLIIRLYVIPLGDGA
jgi:hypothetical protein